MRNKVSLSFKTTQEDKDLSDVERTNYTESAFSRDIMEIQVQSISLESTPLLFCNKRVPSKNAHPFVYVIPYGFLRCG